VDAAALLVSAGAVAIEAAADRQLRRFRVRGAEPTAILAEGLWALCRHPNYLGEVLFWWGLYLFGLAGSRGSWWTVVGPLAMTFLFVAVSVPMMDRHLGRGRPGYAEHRRQLPALLPSPARLLRLARRPDRGDLGR
jgi:steroid 5-alpha reductase family enzyme